MKSRAHWLTLLALLAVSEGASAAGLEDPMAPTARQQALGGAGLGASGDAATVLQNPAGLGTVEGLELLGGVTLAMSQNNGTPPGAGPSASEHSGYGLPVVAAAARLEDWLGVGFGVAPWGAAGAAYTSASPASVRQALAYELTPAVALTLPESLLAGRLAVGVGYRVLYAQQSLQDAGSRTQLDASGWSGSGLRLGAQYSPLPELRLGVAFTNENRVGTGSAAGVLDGTDVTNTRSSLFLPWRLGGGLRFDLDRYGLALDYEFAATSRNVASTVQATSDAGEVLSSQPRQWLDQHTLRVGFEYRLPMDAVELPLRVGYALQSAVASPAYPDAYGTPPAPLHTFSLGGGYRAREFQLNGALFIRQSAATVTAAELGAGCASCGGAGPYSLVVLGASVDASVRFDL